MLYIECIVNIYLTLDRWVLTLVKDEGESSITIVDNSNDDHLFNALFSIVYLD